MALIKCPECGGMVSDQAPACIHCGYPLNRENTAKTSGSQATVEPIPYVLVLYDVGPHRIKCGTKLMDLLNIKSKEATAICDAVIKAHEEITLSINLKPDTLGETKKDFDELECGTKIIEADPNNRYIPGQAIVQNVIFGYTSGSEIQQDVPKCPTCGSTNIKRISGAGRLASTAAFGIASKKMAKTFKCNKCGYTW